jgi:O-antigen ligase
LAVVSRHLLDDLRVAGAGAGAALTLALLVSLAEIDKVPGSLPAALLALAALTVWRPDLGLAGLAFAVPLASWAGRHWNYYVAWAEALTLAFAAGWFLRAVFWPPRPRDRFDPPIQIASAVVAASLAVGVAVMNWRVTGHALTLEFLELAASRYFVVKSSGDMLDAALRLLESFLLFRAASACAAANPAVTPRLVGSVVLGAAVAGGLNVWRLLAVAARSDAPVATFLDILGRIRENIHFPDLNAAGSYYVLALFAAIGLARMPGGIWWSAAALPIAGGLWISGSRTAVAAGLVAAVVPVVIRSWSAGSSRLRWTLATAAVVLVASAGAAAHYLPHRGTQRSSIDALQVRWELAKTSLRITADHPAFGAGVGQYYQLSGRYSSPELLRLFPPAQNENAHNNFLQILAELGLVGFAAFMWLVGVAAWSIVRSLPSGSAAPLQPALAAGLAAFVLTWLGGHPLLTDEPAFTFWIVLGAAAGWPSAGVAAPERWMPSRGIVALVIGVVLVAIPARTRELMADANMEHHGFGLSAWQSAADGVRYRLSAGRSTVFVPADARAVTIPLRAVEPGRALDVQLRLDGRAADLVRVPPDYWYPLRFMLPASDGRRRFRRLDIDVSGAREPGPDVLMVGKVDAQ